jgi:ubiquinone/menaquinone biosynthesis C-methylase UbiE
MLGLASRVAPGAVIGIDAEPSQVVESRNNAARQGLQNISSRVATVYELPFESGTFDVVFAHALFEHLAEPLRALSEIRRVLKPGGMVGLCSPDWGGFILAPPEKSMNAAVEFYKDLQIQNGGDPYVGRKLGQFLLDGGFSSVKTTARYECYDDLHLIAEYLAQRIEAVPVTDAFTVDHQSQLSRALRQWATTPGGMFAQAWVEAVGFV